MKPLKKSGDIKYEWFLKNYSVAPTNAKFVTCAEDKVLKIWDFEKSVVENEKNGF